MVFKWTVASSILDSGERTGIHTEGYIHQMEKTALAQTAFKAGDRDSEVFSRKGVPRETAKGKNIQREEETKDLAL